MIFNIILLISGIIGFITAGITYRSHKLNSTMNIYIVLIIIIFSLRYLLFGILFFISENSITSILLNCSNISIITIPLFYLYVKNLNKNNCTFENKELRHFIIPISLFSIIIVFKYLKIDFQYIHHLFYLIFLLYTIYYILLCYRFLKHNIWPKKDTLKILNKQNLLKSKWAYFIFFAIVIIAFRLLISMFYELQYKSNINGTNYLWISALIWLSVLIKILVSPEILYGYNALFEKADENRIDNLALLHVWDTTIKQQITNTQHLQLREKINSSILGYIEAIEKITLKDHIFRNPTITIIEVANKLNIPKSHITYLFKYHSTISFSEYKKVVRIQDALRLIDKDYLKESTLNYLSKKVGFPSYNTFFTSFKEVTGISPLEYLKSDRRNR